MVFKVQSEKLKKLGFNDSVRGAIYMDCALKIIERDRDVQFIELYEKIAEEFNTKPENVNSGIRYAIRKWWDDVSQEVKEKYFKFHLSIGKTPTNKAFLLILSSEKM